MQFDTRRILFLLQMQLNQLLVSVLIPTLETPDPCSASQIRNVYWKKLCELNQKRDLRFSLLKKKTQTLQFLFLSCPTNPPTASVLCVISMGQLILLYP